MSNHTPETLTEVVQEALDIDYVTNVFTVSYDARKRKLYIVAEPQSELKLFTDE